MVKVLEEKSVPKATVTCPNCGSLIEYGNGDLSIKYRNDEIHLYSYFQDYYFCCPVCECEVYTNWIKKE